jgi:hypothetical protein
MVTTLVRAADFVQTTIVESSTLLASELVQRLCASGDITVSFAGMKGLSSSYFNPILNAVKAQAGLSIIGNRLVFQFDSKAQQLVFQRSMDAVARS